MLRILGIGTGEFRKLTIEGYELIRESENVVLQTGRIPLAEELRKQDIRFTSLDGVYEEAEDFDDLKEKARQFFERLEGDTLFCVLGSIFTNELAKALFDPDVQYIGGMGPAEEALDAIGPGKGSDIYLITTASSMEGFSYDGSSDIVITEVDSMLRGLQVLDILSRYFRPEKDIMLIHRGKPHKIKLYELSSNSIWDYSTVIYVSKDDIRDKEGYTVRDLEEIMDMLLGRNGCEWDKAQDHKSLRQYLLEETYEVIEAIDRDDEYLLQDELGDLLYQIVFHAKLAERHSEFDMLGVSTAISRKMIKRHPHIFISPSMKDDWEEIKKREKELLSTGESLRDIPREMGALMHYQKIIRKLDHLEHRKVSEEKIREELELILSSMKEKEPTEEIIGEILQLVVDISYMHDINAEIALNKKIEEALSLYK